MVPQTNAKLAEVRSIAVDYADYDTDYLHYIIHLVDGEYRVGDSDGDKLLAIRDVVDENDGRPGIAEIEAVLAR